jgi:predicted AAA+ superfamily ATPase
MVTSQANITEIQNALRAFNPWWQSKKFPVKVFRRNAFFQAYQAISQAELRRFALLVGPRRVGKTTILLQIVDELLSTGVPASQVVYISLDHPILRHAALDLIIKAYAEAAESDPGQVQYILLDEIHYAKNWSSWMKLFVDFNHQMRLIATGSASFSVSKESRESAAGRFLAIHIPPLLFSEYLALRGVGQPQNQHTPGLDELFKMSQQERTKLAAQCDHFQNHLQRYLLAGGFPEIAQIDDLQAAQMLLRQDVLESVIKRDLVAFFSTRTVDDLESLFLYLSLHSGGIVSIQQLCSEMRLSKPTVNNLISVLEQASLIFRLPSLDHSGKKFLKSRHKYYAADSSLRCSLLLRSNEVFSDAAETGIIAETSAIAHIMAAYQRRALSIGFWRDARTQKEVDVVIQTSEVLLPVEIKYRERVQIGKASGIVAFSQNVQIQQALIVTKSSADFLVEPLPTKTPTDVLKIPLPLFLYLMSASKKTH